MPRFSARANLRQIAIRGSSLKDAGDEPMIVLTMQLPLSEVVGSPVAQLAQRVKKDLDLTFEWFDAGQQRALGEAGGQAWCNWPRHGECHMHRADGQLPAYWHCKDQPQVSLPDPCEHIKTDTAPEDAAPVLPEMAVADVCHQDGEQWWCAVASVFSVAPCEHVLDQLEDVAGQGAVEAPVHVAEAPVTDSVEAETPYDVVPYTATELTGADEYVAREAEQAEAVNAQREQVENAGFIEVDGCDWSPYAQKGHCKKEPSVVQLAPCSHIEREWRKQEKAAAGRELVGATTGGNGGDDIPF